MLSEKNFNSWKNLHRNVLLKPLTYLKDNVLFVIFMIIVFSF